MRINFERIYAPRSDELIRKLRTSLSHPLIPFSICKFRFQFRSLSLSLSLSLSPSLEFLSILLSAHIISVTVPSWILKQPDNVRDTSTGTADGTAASKDGNVSFLPKTEVVHTTTQRTRVNDGTGLS